MLSSGTDPESYITEYTLVFQKTSYMWTPCETMSHLIKPSGLGLSWHILAPPLCRPLFVASSFPPSFLLNSPNSLRLLLFFPLLLLLFLSLLFRIRLLHHLLLLLLLLLVLLLLLLLFLTLPSDSPPLPTPSSLLPPPT